MMANTTAAYSQKPPLGIGSMTREQLDVELTQGVASVRAGSVISADEVDELLSAYMTAGTVPPVMPA